MSIMADSLPYLGVQASCQILIFSFTSLSELIWTMKKTDVISHHWLLHRVKFSLLKSFEFWLHFTQYVKMCKNLSSHLSWTDGLTNVSNQQYIDFVGSLALYWLSIVCAICSVCGTASVLLTRYGQLGQHYVTTTTFI